MSIRPPSLAALVTLTAATCSCGCDLPACQSTETATFSLRPSEGQLVGATRVATAQDEELFAAQASVANIRASSGACSDRSCRSGSVDLAAP